jgi:hypothetical protein
MRKQVFVPWRSKDGMSLMKWQIEKLFGKDCQIILVAQHEDKIGQVPRDLLMVLVAEDGSLMKGVDVASEDIFIIKDANPAQLVAMVAHLSTRASRGQFYNVIGDRAIKMAMGSHC